MAVAFDAKNTSDVLSAGTVTTLTNSNLTVGSGSNRLLIAMVVFAGTLPTITQFQWDKLGTPQNLTAVTLASTSSATFSAAIYALVAPTSGNKQLSVTWTGALECMLACVSFTGVDQTSVAVACPHGNSANGTSVTASVTITSATGNMVVGTYCDNTNGFSSTSGTNVFQDNLGVNINGAGNYDNGAASVAVTGTFTASSVWRCCGCDILAVASGSPVIPYDISKGSWRIKQTQIDLSRATNLNLYKNPIPFGPFDYSDGPHSIRRFAPDASKLTNLNLYKNPIPFGPYDYGDGPWRIKPTPLSIQPYNQSLYSVTVTVSMMGQIWI